MKRGGKAILDHRSGRLVRVRDKSNRSLETREILIYFSPRLLQVMKERRISKEERVLYLFGSDLGDTATAASERLD